MNRMYPILLASVFLCLFTSTLEVRAGDFESATPEECGIRSEGLREMSEWVREEELDVRSMIVLQKGRLAFEWYAGGVTRDHNHNIFSVTKSVVGVLYGIAIQEGVLGPNTTLGEVLSGSKELVDDPKKAGITAMQLLTMQGGFPVTRGNQPTGPARELFDQIHNAPDRTAMILKTNLASEPGRGFAYNNIDPQLVLSLLEVAYHKKGLLLAKEKLFGPLEFENFEWVYQDETGTVPGGYGLRLRAIDLAKLGQLYLQHGEWEGTQRLPKEYVAAATSDRTTEGKGYGYFWWTSPNETGGAFMAKGVRGQQIFVDPGRELVFVITSDLPPERVKMVTKMLSKRVVNAFVASSLPENFIETEALKKELVNATQYAPPHRNTLPKARLPRVPAP